MTSVCGSIRVDYHLWDATSVHWHGIRLNNSADGQPGLTQDPIQPGKSMLYEFTPPDAGSYLFHPTPASNSIAVCTERSYCRAAIHHAIETAPFVGEGHRKIWAGPRRHGICTSRKRVLRLMREDGVLAPNAAGAQARPARPRPPRSP